MAGFYIRPAPTAPITQGDIFHGVPIIGVSLAKLNQIVQDGTGIKAASVQPDAITDGMILLEKVRITNAIVISQSCDTERVPHLMLAPLSPFTLTEKTAERKWKKINHAATSLGEPKSVYLPGNPTLNVARCIADFGLAFTLPREFLEELAQRGKRVAGLSEKAIGFLQFRLAVLLTRLAQDDFAWPSKEDLDIKIDGLTEQIAAQEKSKGLKAAELARHPQGNPEIVADLAEADVLIEHLKGAKKQAEEHRASADELGGEPPTG